MFFKKLSDNTMITANTVSNNIFSPASTVQKTLSVSDFQQDNWYFCQPASAQMISAYYNVGYSQNYIYQMMNWVAPEGVNNTCALLYYKSSSGLNKPNSWSTTSVTYPTARAEINNNRPYMSGTSTHARVCRGYKYDSSSQYLYINDPWLTTLFPYWEAYGSETDRIYMRS